MTTSEIIACAISVTAAIVSITAWIGARRQATRARRITFPRRMSGAEAAAFKARWQATYKPGCAHPVEPLDEDGVCAAYQPPTTPADSGLCARCGMFDYKHQEASGA